ncbi:hypothetical protein GCM10023194_74760 [Planotetraspora phitsanulokensis]|uniref:Uncharacterized protein n=1 Tax=Planotetraspora phitsanulokensis TaxID=575192 RepID=A0A8J3XDV3_9ACTN|nr:hypothetical protein Pph01_20270 [Planotetraspora phitsanulokensis]
MRAGSAERYKATNNTTFTGSQQPSSPKQLAGHLAESASREARPMNDLNAFLRAR